jgi:hypothetical protein
MEKRGQFTIIVIIGLVVLFVFGLTLYAVNTVKRQSLASDTSKQIQVYLDQNSLNQYVTGCLDAVTDEAIIRAGGQAGLFNPDDYIVYNDQNNNRTFTVPIVIKPNTECTKVNNLPPDYPYPATIINPANNLNKIYKSSCYYSDLFQQFSGFFGYNALTKLCNWDGANRINATPSYGFLTCEAGTYDTASIHHSVQGELENFIATEMKKCANPGAVQNTYTSNITITNDPKATITFGANGMKVNLQYPFNLAVKGRQPVVKLVDFSINKNIPFKELYDYAFYAITQETQDATFDIVRDKDTVRLYKGYDVEKISNVDKKDDLSTDIIQITDKKSIVAGMPLRFQFAIANRRPALEYLHQANSEEYDIKVHIGDTIQLRPQGYDPDDDSLTYSYSLWKEDYDQRYNSDSACSQPPSIAYMIQNCTIILENTQPKNWTGSSEFQTTHQYSSYQTDSNDAGYHIVRISVWDRDKLIDFQDVRILVFDAEIASAVQNDGIR